MKRVLFIAMLALAGSIATAQTTVITRSSSDGVTTEKTTTYESRTEAAYRSIGIPTETIVKLRDYDAKIRDARLSGDPTVIRRYYDSQISLLKPEQVTAVRTYLRTHPVTTGEKIVTYWEESPEVVKEVRTAPSTTVITKEAPAAVTKEVRVQPAEVRVQPAEVRVQPAEVKTAVPSTTIKTEEVTTVKTTTTP